MKNKKDQSNNHQKISNKKNLYLKYRFWLISLMAIIALIFIAKFLIEEFNYLSFKKKVNQDHFDNIETQIYSSKTDINLLPKENKEEKIYDEKFSLLNLVIKQQAQIDQLQRQYQELEKKLSLLKNQDQLSQIIINFVELERAVDLGLEDNKIKLIKLKSLSLQDEFLVTKLKELELILEKEPRSSKQIIKDFTNLIPEILAEKTKSLEENNISSKFKNFLKRVIIIRKIDEDLIEDPRDIELIILQIEKAITSLKYEEAIKLISSLEENYKIIMSQIILDLENAKRLRALFEEIFIYLAKGANYQSKKS